MCVEDPPLLSSISPVCVPACTCLCVCVCVCVCVCMPVCEAVVEGITLETVYNWIQSPFGVTVRENIIAVPTG